MKLKNTKLDYVLQGASFICLLATSLYLLFNWGNIDGQIPAHYGSGGVIDRLGNKSELIITLVIGWVIDIGMMTLSKFPNMWNIPINPIEEKREEAYLITKHLLGWEMLIISINFSFLSLYPLTNKNLPSFYMLLVIGMVFGLMGIYLIKLYRIK